jgi:hypothetical protein
VGEYRLQHNLPLLGRAQKAKGPRGSFDRKEFGWNQENSLAFIGTTEERLIPTLPTVYQR